MLSYICFQLKSIAYNWIHSIPLYYSYTLQLCVSKEINIWCIDLQPCYRISMVMIDRDFAVASICDFSYTFAYISRINKSFLWWLEQQGWQRNPKTLKKLFSFSSDHNARKGYMRSNQRCLWKRPNCLGLYRQLSKLPHTVWANRTNLKIKIINNWALK